MLVHVYSPVTFKRIVVADMPSETLPHGPCIVSYFDVSSQHYTISHPLCYTVLGLIFLVPDLR